MKYSAIALVAALLLTETSCIRIAVEDPGDSMEMKVETAIVKEEIKNKMKAKELEDYIKYHYDKVGGGGGAEAEEEKKEEKKAAKKEAKKAEKKAEKKDAKEEKKDDAKEEKKDEKKEEKKE